MSSETVEFPVEPSLAMLDTLGELMWPGEGISKAGPPCQIRIMMMRNVYNKLVRHAEEARRIRENSQ